MWGMDLEDTSFQLCNLPTDKVDKVEHELLSATQAGPANGAGISEGVQPGRTKLKPTKAL
ncbi:hypothetical protein FS749_010142, partial [Ceratobasidium sp. UAMH 11750]